MKQTILLFLLTTLWGFTFAQQNATQYHEITDFSPTDTLIRVTTNESKLNEDFCYVNQKGDTVIPFGRFKYSFSDTITTFGIVIESNGEKQEMIGINQKGERLYEVQIFDNGPDYIEDGLFRILRNGKTGFADTSGKIIIKPQYNCAFQFSEGKAKVAFECTREKDHDYTIMISDHWFYIDKNGKEIK